MWRGAPAAFDSDPACAFSSESRKIKKQQQNRRQRAGVTAAPSLAPCRLVLFTAGVIAGAGLNFVALLVLDLKLAVGTVELGVRRGVADVVLAAQFGSDLIEGVAELVELVAHVDDAAAGLLGQSSHF